MGSGRLFSQICIIGDTDQLMPQNIRSSVEFVKEDTKKISSHNVVIMHVTGPPRVYVEDLILLGASVGGEYPKQTYILADEPVFHDWLGLSSRMLRGQHIFTIVAKNMHETYKYINNICGLRSPLEHYFFQGLCMNGLGPIVQSQKSVGGLWVDFLFPKDNVVVEVNGTKYHSSEDAKARDLEKRQSLMKLGYSVMTYTDKEINANLDACITELKHFIKIRSLENGV
jgi:very-short-patch-repair endonuclease